MGFLLSTANIFPPLRQRPIDPSFPLGARNLPLPLPFPLLYPFPSLSPSLCSTFSTYPLPLSLLLASSLLHALPFLSPSTPPPLRSLLLSISLSPYPTYLSRQIAFLNANIALAEHIALYVMVKNLLWVAYMSVYNRLYITTALKN